MYGRSANYCSARAKILPLLLEPSFLKVSKRRSRLRAAGQLYLLSLQLLQAHYPASAPLGQLKISLLATLGKWPYLYGRELVNILLRACTSRYTTLNIKIALPPKKLKAF